MVKVADGKYEVLHENGAGLRALRYGEPWRDLTGDGLVLALVQRIEELEAAQSSSVPTFDLDTTAWEQIKKAASESEWMPPEYMANDWHYDVCEYLRHGPPKP